MSSTRYIWLLPVCLLALAALAGLAAYIASGSSTVNSWLLALAVFCSVAVLLLYGWVMWRTRQTESKLEQSLLLENEILSRLQAEESGALLEAAKYQHRLESLETRLDESERLIEDIMANPSGDAVNQLRAQTPSTNVVFDDKVVPLNKDKRVADTASQENVDLSQREVERLLDDGQYFFRLQPIINLIDKKMVGLQAFSFCILDGEAIPADTFMNDVPIESQSAINLKLVKEIGRILRQLEKDGSLVPIHFEFTLPPGPSNENWDALLQVIQADPLLQQNFLPVLKDRRLLQPDNDAIDKLMALREAGLKLCLADTNSTSNILTDVKSRHFSCIKIPAAELLRYRRSERERVADQLIPELERRDIAVYVDNVDRPHQASQLFDLEIAGVHGSTIGEARALRIYEGIDPLIQKNTTAEIQPIA